jgi:hypothetical protein
MQYDTTNVNPCTGGNASSRQLSQQDERATNRCLCVTPIALSEPKQTDHLKRFFIDKPCPVAGQRVFHAGAQMRWQRSLAACTKREDEGGDFSAFSESAGRGKTGAPARAGVALGFAVGNLDRSAACTGRGTFAEYIVRVQLAQICFFEVC